MTALRGFGYSQYNYIAPPWLRDPAFTNVYVYDARHNGYTNQGATYAPETVLVPSVGSTTPNASAGCTFDNNGNSVGVQNANLQPADSNSYIRVTSYKSFFTGTATAFTVIICFQAVTSLTTGLKYVLHAYKASTNTPQVYLAGTGNQNGLSFGRVNDAGTGFATSSFNIGTTPAIVVFTYDGTNATLRKNGSTIDNAIAFGGGAMTIDNFLIGRGKGGGSSLHKHYFFSISSGAMASSSYKPVEDYWGKMLRL